MNTYKIEYCDVKNALAKSVNFNIDAVNIHIAIAKAAVIATKENAIENYTFVYIKNVNNSSQLFDQNNEGATFDLEDISNHA